MLISSTFNSLRVTEDLQKVLHGVKYMSNFLRLFFFVYY